MQQFFKAKTIAVIGVSQDATKIGHRVFKKLLKQGKSVYAINHRGTTVLGRKVYKHLKNVREKVDLAIIAMPKQSVVRTLKDCAKKNIKNIIILSSHTKDQELKQVAKKYKLNILGPHSLGILDTHNNIDTIFSPESKLTRPQKGSISIMSQSGPFMLSLLDHCATQGIGIAKCIDYGLGNVLHETKVLHTLIKDARTKVICIYLEDFVDPQGFLEVAKKSKKPIILLKGGKDQNYPVYKGALEQVNVHCPETLHELMDILQLASNVKQSKKNRVAIISNSHAHALLAKDCAHKYDLPLAVLQKQTIKHLEKDYTHATNPILLGAKANAIDIDNALKLCITDKNVDAILLITVKQSPYLEDTAIISKYQKKKPIIVVSPEDGFPLKNTATFNYPENAIKAIKMWMR